MAGPLKPLPILDFSAGENTVTSPYLLKPNQSQQCINLLLDEHGALRVRDGTLVQTVAAPRPDRPIVKLFDFVQVDGTVRRFALQYGTFGPNSLFLRDTSPWTLIGDFTQAYLTPDMLTFNGQAIIANGNQEVLKRSDGTAATGLVALVGAPNGAHIAQHLNYLWAWNTLNASAALAGPSSLQSSDINNSASWPAGNQTFIAKDDGTSGQALAQYTIAEAGISPTATLICWKDFAGYEATGVLGAATFSVQKIKSDMGCVAPRSVQFVAGFGIIRLTHRGFALYDGVNDTLISEEERPRIFGRDSYTGLDWSNITRCMATQVANPPLYICACPVQDSNGRLQRVFIFDLVRRAWTVCQYANDIGTMQLTLDPNVLPSVLIGDANRGYVRRAFAGDTTDDEVAINWNLVTRAVSMGTPMERAYWRRMLAKFFGMTAGSSVSATFFYGPTAPVGQTTLAKTIPTVTPLNSYTGWGSDPWSSTPWGSQNAATITDTDLEFAMGMKANNVTVSLSGSGPGKIRGLEFHARPQVPTRSTVVNA